MLYLVYIIYICSLGVKKEGLLILLLLLRYYSKMFDSSWKEHLWTVRCRKAKLVAMI